jgi:hypothetical protein
MERVGLGAISCASLKKSISLKRGWLWRERETMLLKADL